MQENYVPIIGIEVHTQLLTRTKAFCSTNIGVSGDIEPNTHVGISSSGLPGSLPSLNTKVVELAVRAGLALNCNIQKRSVFARKHYFYPDLPKGYQISQYADPICRDGSVLIPLKEGTKLIRIERIHIEEDAGKLTHSAGSALVDLNRAGVALVEIVSHADITSTEEAVAYIKTLHERLVYAQVTDGNLEAGNFRADVNVSIKKRSAKEWGTRAELKNINSFKFVEAALEFEIQRQIAIVSSGGRVLQETRGWDEASKTTFSMRSKENAPDYRYFPDPDLPPLCLNDEYIESIRKTTPELPDAIRERLRLNYQLLEADIERLVQDQLYVRYLDDCVLAGALPRDACNWFFSEFLRELSESKLSNPYASPISPQHFSELLKLQATGKISGKIAKSLFKKMWATGKNPIELAHSENLSVVSDAKQIQAWVDEVLLAQSNSAKDYQQGKIKVFDFLMGQLMRISKGKADPELARKLMLAALSIK